MRRDISTHAWSEPVKIDVGIKTKYGIKVKFLTIKKITKGWTRQPFKVPSKLGYSMIWGH